MSITTNDYWIGQAISCQYLGIIRGKTTRKDSPSLQHNYIATPKSILIYFGRITFFHSILYGNQSPIFATCSAPIRLVTEELLQNRRAFYFSTDYHKLVNCIIGANFRLLSSILTINYNSSNY